MYAAGQCLRSIPTRPSPAGYQNLLVVNVDTLLSVSPGDTFRRVSFGFRFFQSCLRPQHPCGVLELNLNMYRNVQGYFSFDSRLAYQGIRHPPMGNSSYERNLLRYPAIIHLAASCCCGWRFSLTQFVYICICGTGHLTITGREGTVQIHSSLIGNHLHPASEADIASEDWCTHDLAQRVVQRLPLPMGQFVLIPPYGMTVARSVGAVWSNVHPF